MKLKNPRLLFSLSLFSLAGVLLMALIFAVTNSNPVFEAEEVSLGGGESSVADDSDASNGNYINFAGISGNSVAGCSHFVSPSGSDSASGTSSSAAWKSSAKAVGSAQPGDVVCFAPGDYNEPFDIENIHGTDSQWITFKSQDINNKPHFSGKGVSDSSKVGVVAVWQSSYVVLEGIKATDGLRGINIGASKHISLLDCEVSSVGQEGIHISYGLHGRYRYPSENILVEGCDISNTGARPGSDSNFNFSVYGESIYVGTGDPQGKPNDETKNVIIRNNHIHNNAPATAEAINIKSSTANVLIEGNLIHDIDSWCEGAVRVDSSSGLKILNNRIYNITASGTGGDHVYKCQQAEGIRSGSSGAVISGNIIWNAKDKGIWLEGGSGITLMNNTVYGSGNQDFLFSQDQVSSSSGNLSSDGSSGVLKKQAGEFIGPVTGEADAGQGPGSGFELR